MSKNRKTNDLFIGKDKLNLEGRSVKHPSLIKIFGNLNVNKITKDKPNFIGIDLETNHLTGELKLLGIYDEKYNYYTKNFLGVLFDLIKNARYSKKKIVWWNKLDPFVIYKQFLLAKNYKEQEKSLAYYSKISGEYSSKECDWKTPPVVEIKIGNYYFGITNVIRSSIQFYFYNEFKPERIHRVWAYDIATLYDDSLEKEAKRLKYYSKVDKSAHLVNWFNFENDKDYRENIVLKSNELDARAVRDLAYESVNNFYKIFGFYPRSIISAGSLARAGIVAVINNLHHEQKEKVLEDLQSIGIVNYYEDWFKTLGQEKFKDMLSIFNESYSGGYIEAISYGTAKVGYMADIASAYPSVAVNLYDLRGAKITYGKGTPPHIDKSYCFVRGDITVPENIDYHPITIKHPVLLDTNIRATGNYRCSYTIKERDYLLTLGATFKNEEWYNIKTKGKLSPLAIATKKFLASRKRMLAKGDSAQYTAKTCANSIYGILYEAIKTYTTDTKEIIIDSNTENFYKDILGKYKQNINLESIKNELKSILDTEYNKVMSMWHNPKSSYYPDIVAEELKTEGITLESTHPVDLLLEINELYRENTKTVNTDLKDITIRDGYRAGEFYNPIYASIITSEVRTLIAKGANAIKNKGGQPIVIMTDSIFWKGNANMLPKELWREEKTLGYFEKPKKITDITCLGAGRYEYYVEGNKYRGKKRGLNIVDLIGPGGMVISDFNWKDSILLAKKLEKEKIPVNVRLLVSVGAVLHQNKWSVEDLGRVVEEEKNVTLVVGHQKRVIPKHSPDDLLKGLIISKPLMMYYKDSTLKVLRDEMQHKNFIPEEKHQKDLKKKNNKKYKERHHSEIRARYRKKYQLLRDKGVSVEVARKLAGSEDKKIKKILKNA